MIVAFVLPEGFAMGTQQMVRAVAGKSFQGSQPPADRDFGRGEQVHVIWHYNECVQLVTMQAAFSVQECILHELRNFRSLKKEGAGGATIQDAIHGSKSLPRGSQLCGRKDALCWEATVQPEGDK